MAQTTVIESLQADEWFMESPELREFVVIAKEIISNNAHNCAEILNALESDFTALLKKENWLPKHFTQPNLNSCLDGEIGQWLLYRSQYRTLTIFSLVIPPYQSTSVHDHLSWGLVGLYQGKQEEIVYRRVDNGELEGQAQLETVATYQLKKGDIYHLLPPDNDIHSVKANTVFSPSISIHVMGNDTGSMWRHHYQPENNSVRSFRSGYSNVFVK